MALVNASSRVIWLYLGTLTWVVVVTAQQGCKAPVAVENGRYEPMQEIYGYNTNVTYHCDSGYQLRGVETRTCRGFQIIQSYIWSGDDPQCIAIACEEPEIPDAVYTSPSNTDYMSSFTYVCNDGLIPMGPQAATCTIDQTWLYTPCTIPEFSCDYGSVPTVPHATHNASDSARHPSGSVIAYTCDDGYITDDVGILTCVETTWLGSPPICNTKPTTVLPNQPNESSTSRIEIPIIAGIVTAAVLTTILLIFVFVYGKRQLLKLSQKNSSIVSSSPPASTAPTEINITPNQSFRLPRNTIRSNHDHHTMQSHRTRPQSPSTPTLHQSYPTIGPSSRSGMNYDTPINPSEAEFHTIRGCLGDFKNNNNPPPPPLLHTPKLSLTLQSPHHAHNRILHQQARSLRGHPYHHHTPQGIPYQAVTCPHGVEHVYQPLEHVYEEPHKPHIWMQPLPNPNQ